MVVPGMVIAVHGVIGMLISFFHRFLLMCLAIVHV
jgi:hypothetical protein